MPQPSSVSPRKSRPDDAFKLAQFFYHYQPYIGYSHHLSKWFPHQVLRWWCRCSYLSPYLPQRKIDANGHYNFPLITSTAKPTTEIMTASPYRLQHCNKTTNNNISSRSQHSLHNIIIFCNIITCELNFPGGILWFIDHDAEEPIVVFFFATINKQTNKSQDILRLQTWSSRLLTTLMAFVVIFCGGSLGLWLWPRRSITRQSPETYSLVPCLHNAQV